MTTQCGVGVSQLGTATNDYTNCYYACYGSDSEQEYSWDSAEWRAFFTLVANKVVSLIGPARVFDVGCARGLLVQALVEAGVDAHGTDISETAVASAHPDVRGRLSVANAVDPIDGSWDLVSCIEVLEHLAPNDADRAIANMCAATERVLFSSVPGEYAEPTHVNVRSPADWAASFAERGFFRRTDLDVSFLTPWAVLFERADLDVRAVVHRYEAYAYPMRVEVLDKRAALLEAHRTISRQHDEPEAETAALEAEKAALQAQISEFKHRLLTSRDHAIGAEATAARAVIDLAKVNAQKVSLEQEIQDLKNSERWRVGGWAAAPASLMKRVMRRRP
jgi:SAM-dependent methyltransferase